MHDRMPSISLPLQHEADFAAWGQELTGPRMGQEWMDAKEKNEKPTSETEAKGSLDYYRVTRGGESGDAYTLPDPALVPVAVGGVLLRA